MNNATLKWAQYEQQRLARYVVTIFLTQETEQDFDDMSTTSVEYCEVPFL